MTEHDRILAENLKRLPKREPEKCPKCGSTNLYVQRWGLTKMCGDVLCSDCGAYVRMWDAY